MTLLFRTSTWGRQQITLRWRTNINICWPSIFISCKSKESNRSYGIYSIKQQNWYYSALTYLTGFTRYSNRTFHFHVTVRFLRFICQEPYWKAAPGSACIRAITGIASFMGSNRIDFSRCLYYICFVCLFFQVFFSHLLKPWLSYVFLLSRYPAVQINEIFNFIPFTTVRATKTWKSGGCCQLIDL